jgi:hypothetical protein
VNYRLGTQLFIRKRTAGARGSGNLMRRRR